MVTQTLCDRCSAVINFMGDSYELKMKKPGIQISELQIDYAQLCDDCAQKVFNLVKSKEVYKK